MISFVSTSYTGYKSHFLWFLPVRKSFKLPLRRTCRRKNTFKLHSSNHIWTVRRIFFKMIFFHRFKTCCQDHSPYLYLDKLILVLIVDRPRRTTLDVLARYTLLTDLTGCLACLSQSLKIQTVVCIYHCPKPSFSMDLPPSR